MKIKHISWTIEELSKNFKNIDYPEFQREGAVWTLDKKQRLIDSILRDFDISSIYLFEKNKGDYDCIDGQQRINAILSYLNLKGDKDEDNAFHLRIENEIYNDMDAFRDANRHKFKSLSPEWKKVIMNYKLNIVLITEVNHDEELNLLFLRLQIASVLNAGEKLNAMTGQMRDLIFHDISKCDYFKKIKISKKRFAKEQVAAQIVLNIFSIRDTGFFRRSRYIDLQDFFKQYYKFDSKDTNLINDIKEKLKEIYNNFNPILEFLKNRALTVSFYFFASQLIQNGDKNDIEYFKKFFLKFLKTLKWQIPLNVKMDEEYYDLLNFQNYVTQAAGEKYAIQKRHDFLQEYFYYYKKNENIKGDEEYKNNKGKDPDHLRDAVKL